MIRSAATTLSAADGTVTLSLDTLGDPISTATIFLANTSMTTGVWKVQGRPAGQSTWVNVGWVDLNSLTVQSGGNFSATNSTDYAIVVPNVGMFDAVRLYLVSVGSGSYLGTVYGLTEQEARDMNFPVSIINSATAQTITSTSATAFAVGRQGSTNPVLNVNANTASVVTGLTLIGAAAGSGMQVTVTSSGTNEGLLVDAKGSGTIRFGAVSTGAIEFGRTLQPITNDAAALGTTTLGFSDLHLATGGVINWANGEVSITESDANTLTIAGATALVTGAVTVAVTGTRWVTSYHTNIVSTNAVTVDSSMTVKNDIIPYKGDALETIRKIDVCTYRHKDHLDNGCLKLGMVAESLNEGLALDQIEKKGGGTYPGINLYALAAIQTRAIQQLAEQVERIAA